MVPYAFCLEIQMVKTDWENFDAKKENAMQLFDDSNEVKAETIKKFLKQFSCFREDVYFSKVGYSRKTEEHSWKTYMLCNYNRFSKQVEQFLFIKSQTTMEYIAIS
jgi:hypothetical protein